MREKKRKAMMEYSRASEKNVKEGMNEWMINITRTERERELYSEHLWYIEIRIIQRCREIIECNKAITAIDTIERGRRIAWCSRCIDMTIRCVHRRIETPLDVQRVDELFFSLSNQKLLTFFASFSMASYGSAYKSQCSSLWLPRSPPRLTLAFELPTLVA